MCTGGFFETSAGNGAARPPPGTPCAKPCAPLSGRWGENFCYTQDKAGKYGSDGEWDGSGEPQWGAPCLPCSGNISITRLAKTNCCYIKIPFQYYVLQWMFFNSSGGCGIICSCCPDYGNNGFCWWVWPRRNLMHVLFQKKNNPFGKFKTFKIILHTNWKLLFSFYVHSHTI